MGKFLKSASAFSFYCYGKKSIAKDDVNNLSDAHRSFNPASKPTEDFFDFLKKKVKG